MWKSHLRWALLFYRAILNKMTSIKNEAGNLLPQAFVFNASNQQVRTVLLDGEPYFVAKDVCSILDISNHIDAVSRLDDDEKGRSVIPTQFGDKEINLVNESGLYHLIFQSRKSEAKAFRKWVTSEVLPALRRTGHYELAVPAEEQEPSMIPYRRWSQRYVRPSAWLDLRTEPYTQKTLNGYPVRVISFEDVEWYSVADILRSIQVATSTYQTAAALNASNRELARKIHIFGNTHPAWFTTITGLRLIISSCRSPKSSNITGRL